MDDGVRLLEGCLDKTTCYSRCLVDARLSAEWPDAVASTRTSTARTPADVMGWTAATQLANRLGCR